MCVLCVCLYGWLRVRVFVCLIVLMSVWVAVVCVSPVACLDAVCVCLCVCLSVCVCESVYVSVV